MTNSSRTFLTLSSQYNLRSGWRSWLRLKLISLCLI